MPCSDWVLEWELLLLLLRSYEPAHLPARVGLVLHSNRILEDVEEAEVVHQKWNLVGELSEQSLWEPISAVPNSASSPGEAENPDSLANGTNQTEIQVCRRRHWT